jgi:hypothetical protein
MDLIEKERIQIVVGYRPLVGRRGLNGEIFEFGVAATEALRRRHPDRFEMIFSRNGAEVLKVRRSQVGILPGRNESHREDSGDA